MTIKEITALRKSGRVDEALSAARAELASNPNKFTASAVFWCLNDLYRQQAPEKGAELVAEMKELYRRHCPGDEFMQKSIARAEQHLMPHAAELKEALERSKGGGNAVGEYMKFADLYDRGELNQALFNDFGWLTYYGLKASSSNDVMGRKLMLHRYLKLGLPRPSLLHSRILAEAVRLEQTVPLHFRVRDFISLWGLENLTEDDWSQFTTDAGNVLPSLVEKLIGVYVKELKTDRVEAPEEFGHLVDKALIRYPKNQNMPYFKAVVLLSQGKREEAIGHYRDLILKFPSKFYLWSELAELVDEVGLRIGLLCKALTSGTEDEFLGSIRLRLAAMLIAEGKEANARYELEKYRETYNAKGWRLKDDYWNIHHQIAAIAPADDNRSLYARYTPEAEKFIYEALPGQLMVKVGFKLLDDRNHPGRKIPVWILRGAKSLMRLKKPGKFGLDSKSRDGALFLVKVKDDRIVWIKPFEGTPSENWIKVVEGKADKRTDRKGNPFAIVERVYVGEKLLKGVPDGATVKVLALLQTDGRWSAVSRLKNIKKDNPRT